MHVYTSFTLTYLSRARVLAQTLRAAHPEWVLWAIVVDKPPRGFDSWSWKSDFDHVVEADQLFGADYESWMFKHDVVEACTAVKGRALQHILASDSDKVIYLDPDIAVFHDLGPVYRNLDEASIILTPHQLEPNDEYGAILDNELTSLRYGTYKLGFIAVKNDCIGRAFAKWWEAQLYRACYDEVASGIFTDQKYCDLVPGLFDRVRIERDPGYNVASWNISQRNVAITPAGQITINGHPLRFYHFTKMGSAGDVMTERYAGDNFRVFEIWEWYRRAVSAQRVAGIPDGYWWYGQYDDGQPITKRARVLYRNRADLMNAFPNPFASGPGSYRAWLQQHAPELVVKRPARHFTIPSRASAPA